MKQWKREQVRKYYRENKEQCNFNNKMSKLSAKGVVEWQGIDLTPKPKDNKKIYTEEEIKQCKRDYYNNKYYSMHKEAVLRG